MTNLQTDFDQLLSVRLSREGFRKIQNSDRCFELLQSRFPADGNKIAWDRVEASISKKLKLNQYAEQAEDFFEELIPLIRDSTIISYVNDSCIDGTYQIATRDLQNCLGDIVGFPGHHYLTNSWADWCLCFSMEGYADFGFAPT